MFFVVVLAFFYQTIVYQKLPVPSDTLVGLYHPWRDLYSKEYPRGIPFKNFLITDPVRQQIPWRKIAVDAWKEGKWPGWNPYTFTGVSLDANVQAAPFYPFNILFFIFDFPVAWTVLVMLQPLLAGWFMYLYLRMLKLSEISSLVGSLAWSFGGFSIAWLTWGTMMQTALWLPLMLLAVDKSKPILFGIAVIMTMLAGHMQIAFYTTLVAVLYLLWRRKLSKRYLVIFIIAGVITSMQWVPFIKSLMESGRVLGEGWKNPGWFLPWQHVAQFIAPDFFGNPATLNYWGEWNYGEFIGFIGIVPLVFAFAGLNKVVQKEYRFWVVVFGISLLFMLPSPIRYGTAIIPLLSSLQPTRLMVLVNFSLAVMAAIGFHTWQQEKTKLHLWRWYLPGGCILLLWGIVLFSKDKLGTHADTAIRNLILPSVIFGGSFSLALIKHNLQKYRPLEQVVPRLFIVIIIFDLFRFGWKFTPFTSREYFFPTTKVIEFLQKQPKPFRVMSLDDRILPPNVGAYYGIETIEGYDPVIPRNYQTYLGSSGSNRILTFHDIDSPILPHLNIRYVLTIADVERPFLREVIREGDTRVYEYTKSLPRVYLSQSAPESLSILNVPLVESETAEIISYSQNTIRMRVTAVNPRLLVILNRFDRRWLATVDTKKTYVTQVNSIFMGIVISPGTHDVILSYH